MWLWQSKLKSWGYKLRGFQSLVFHLPFGTILVPFFLSHSHVAVVVKTVLVPCWLVGEFTTHFRIYFSGDWDVHWGTIWMPMCFCICSLQIMCKRFAKTITCSSLFTHMF